MTIQSSTAHRCRHCSGKIVEIRPTLHGPPEYQCLACSRPYTDQVPAAAPPPAPAPPARSAAITRSAAAEIQPGIDRAEDRAEAPADEIPADPGPPEQLIAEPSARTDGEIPDLSEKRRRAQALKPERSGFYAAHRDEIKADYAVLGRRATLDKWEIPRGSWGRLRALWGIPSLWERGPASGTAAKVRAASPRLPAGTIAKVTADVIQELRAARRAYPAFNTAHEGYAVILEELEELWTEIKRHDQDPVAMRAEAVQVAAMATRFIIDVTGGD